MSCIDLGEQTHDKEGEKDQHRCKEDLCMSKEGQSCVNYTTEAFAGQVEVVTKRTQVQEVTEHQSQEGLQQEQRQQEVLQDEEDEEEGEEGIAVDVEAVHPLQASTAPCELAVFSAEVVFRYSAV